MKTKQNNAFTFIRYSNCWEDSKILTKGLQIQEGQIGLSVASGGDNTLALLLSNPKCMYAFDLNPTQLYCLEVKMKAIQHLTYEELLSFLGILPCPNPLALLEKFQGDLSEKCYTYFHNAPEIITQGLIHAGKFESYFRLFKKYVAPLFCNNKKLETFCHLNSLAQQEQFYHRYINNLRFRAIFKVYFGMKVMGRLGRDKSFYTYVEQKHTVAEDIKKRFEYGIRHSINQSNPYLRYILTNTFAPTAFPEYLEPDKYAIIKQRLHKIHLLHGSLMDIEDTMKFDFFNLSDIFEYVSVSDFEKNMEKLDRLSKQGSRIAYWNMQNTRYFPPPFKREDTLSQQLFQENQSFFYRDFSIYTKRGYDTTYE